MNIALDYQLAHAPKDLEQFSHSPAASFHNILRTLPNKGVNLNGLQWGEGGGGWGYK